MRKFDKSWLFKVDKDVTFYAEIIRTLPKLSTYYVLQIIADYNERWRWYHNQEHVLEMLGYTAPATFPGGSELTDEERRALRAMIIFHDIVYKIPHKDREKGWNERESAKFAQKALERTESEDFISLVTAGIIATISHSLNDVPEAYRHVVKWLLDIDLFTGIGATWEEFANNSILIGQEFSPVYTSSEYWKGRKAWAGSMLTRERIYLTEHFSQYEMSAREFLAKVIVSP